MANDAKRSMRGKRPDSHLEKQSAPPVGEFCRPGDLLRTFGIGRSQAYLLGQRREIDLISLKPPGTRKGVTLVDVGSVRRFIERRRAASAASTGE